MFERRRLERAYATIERLEAKVGLDAVAMRAAFLHNTVERMDAEQRAAGWSRGERRTLRRKMLNA
jgi:hypothetical protein